jgi:hypothetical protein
MKMDTHLIDESEDCFQSGVSCPKDNDLSAPPTSENTVGREDRKVLPRSFKTLAEAKAYLAQQDKDALERGEFYLDALEQGQVSV